MGMLIKRKTCILGRPIRDADLQPRAAELVVVEQIDRSVGRLHVAVGDEAERGPLVRSLTGGHSNIMYYAKKGKGPSWGGVPMPIIPIGRSAERPIGIMHRGANGPPGRGFADYSFYRQTT